MGMMGSRRNPNTGEHRADIDAGPGALEWHGPAVADGGSGG